MPIYEFQCELCGCVFEELGSYDHLAVKCPECGGDKTHKKISAPGPLKKNPFPFKISPPRPGVKTNVNGCQGSCGKI